MIYVASSWRNAYQPHAVEYLRGAGFEVYDFRHPDPNDHGFHWTSVDPEWERWDLDSYRTGLRHPIAQRGFRKDMEALEAAERVVLVLPCGRSAHLEAGWAIGAGKRCVIYCPEQIEPELMYLMAGSVVGSMGDVVAFLRDPALAQARKGRRR